MTPLAHIRNLLSPMVLAGTSITLSGASIMNATGTPMGFGSGLALIVIGCLLAAGGGYVSALMAAQRANSQHLTEAHATASNTVAEPG